MRAWMRSIGGASSASAMRCARSDRKRSQPPGAWHCRRPGSERRSAAPARGWRPMTGWPAQYRPSRHSRCICAMMWPSYLHSTDKFSRPVIRLQHMASKVRLQVSKHMTSKQILVVEDERPIREMIAFGLKRAGFEVREAEDCRAARAALADQRPDLVLIDWMLPDMSGLELTRALKRDRETRELPVIMLTARAEEGDKVAGLEGGADDYVTKPFSPRELLARINAVLRRATGNGADEMIEFEGLALDQASHRVMVADRTVPLGPTEYRMLEFFMTHPERVYTRDQLLDRIWGGNVYVEERTIDVHIRRLRKALEEFGYDRFVQTVRGSGYRFSARTV